METGAGNKAFYKITCQSQDPLPIIFVRDHGKNAVLHLRIPELKFLSVHYVVTVRRVILSRPPSQVEGACVFVKSAVMSPKWCTMNHTILVSVLILFLLGDGAVSAQDLRKSWEGTIAARILNVRAGPSKNRDIVAKIKRSDRIQAFDEEGSWVHIRDFDDSGKTGWVSRSFLRLPKDFMAPAFGDVENAFLEWASVRGDLSVVSVEADNRLSLVLGSIEENLDASTIAREVACAYRARLKLEIPVVATVWPELGPRDGWVAQVSCP